MVSLWRGLALCSTVLSCPVRLCKAWLFEVWSAIVEWSPVLLGQVVFGSARHGFSWRGKALRGRVQYGEVLYCKVWRFMVRSGAIWRSTVERGFVWLGKVLLWFGEVLFCVVGLDGVMCAKAFCGMVLHCEPLFRVVKFCPVKYCYVILGKVSLRHGTVESGFALLCAAEQAWASFGVIEVLRG